MEIGCSLKLHYDINENTPDYAFSRDIYTDMGNKQQIDETLKMYSLTLKGDISPCGCGNEAVVHCNCQCKPCGDDEEQCTCADKGRD